MEVALMQRREITDKNKPTCDNGHWWRSCVDKWLFYKHASTHHLQYNNNQVSVTLCQLNVSPHRVITCKGKQYSFTHTALKLALSPL